MASPWIPTQRHPDERPWLGMAMLAAIPLLSLVLIRMLWSGSSLWFLTVGIILLGAAAVVFLSRRPQEQEYGRQTLAQETNRAPLILTALGVLFLAMLLLPNFAGGDSGTESVTGLQAESPGDSVSEVSGASEQPAPQAPAQEQNQPPAQDAAPDGAQTYVVQSGDTMWDIAERFAVTVEAITEANDLENPADIAVDQELVIPPPEEEVQAEDGSQ